MSLSLNLNLFPKLSQNFTVSSPLKFRNLKTVAIRSVNEDESDKPRHKNKLLSASSLKPLYLTLAAGLGISWLVVKGKQASNGLSVGLIKPNLEPSDFPTLFIRSPLFLWGTLKEAITVYTGLSPATFFTVLALGLAVYYVISGMSGSSDTHHQRPRSFEEQMQPLPPPVQLGEVTEEHLKQYDGSDPKKPLLMAIKGQIYDVSQSRMFYGPGGPYALFAGKDASKALAKMSFEDKDLTGDISDLGPFELEALQDWEYKFMSKYVKVGTIQKPVPVTDEAASVSEAAEANDADVAKPAEAQDAGDAKPAEDADAAKPAEDVPSATPAVKSHFDAEAKE